jgi:hypothetical protein
MRNESGYAGTSLSKCVTESCIEANPDWAGLFGEKEIADQEKT